MHRTDFIRAVARETGVSQTEVARVLAASFDLIARTLAEDDKVVLTGFGVFEMRGRRARRGVDPRTGAPIVVAATRTPGFTAGRRLKAATATQAVAHRELQAASE